MIWLQLHHLRTFTFVGNGSQKLSGHDVIFDFNFLQIIQSEAVWLAEFVVLFAELVCLCLCAHAEFLRIWTKCRHRHCPRWPGYSQDGRDKDRRRSEGTTLPVSGRRVNIWKGKTTERIVLL